MEKDEILQLIKDYISENLRMESHTCRDWGGEATSIELKLLLDGDIISHQWIDVK